MVSSNPLSPFLPLCPFLFLYVLISSFLLSQLSVLLFHFLLLLLFFLLLLLSYKAVVDRSVCLCSSNFLYIESSSPSSPSTSPSHGRPQDFFHGLQTQRLAKG